MVIQCYIHALLPYPLLNATLTKVAISCDDFLSGEVSLLGGHEDGDGSHQMPCPV